MSILVDNPNWQSFASSLEQDRGLPSGMLRAIAMNETNGGHPDIINRPSTAGAQGMFQFMPDTATQYNVNVSDPADSTRGASDMLSDLMKKYNDPKLAAAAYNWGQGNVDKAIAKATAAGKPTDAISLANNGMLPAETANYVRKIPDSIGAQPQQQNAAPQPFSPDVVKATRDAVTNLVGQGVRSAMIVKQLSGSPVAPMIQSLKAAGNSDDDIVQQIGGDAVKKLFAVQDQSFGTNLAQGAGNAVNDMTLGAKQIFATDPDEVAALQAEAKANAGDMTRQAVNATAGGTVGNFATKAAPAVAAAFIPGGIPAMVATQAAVGAGTAALEPTTEDGQRTRNVVLGGLLGGGTAGTGAVLGKAAGGLAGKLMAGDGQAAERIALAEANGLTPTGAMVDSRLGAIADNIPSARAMNDELATKDLSRQLLKGIGVDGDEITTGAIKQAQGSIYNDADALLAKATVPADSSAIAPKLQDIVSNYSKNTLDTYRSKEVASVADDIIKKIDAGDMTGAGLVQARKNIMSNAFTADGETRQALKQMGQAIDDHLATVAPEAKAALQDANQKWANLQVIENVNRRANGQAITPSQLATSVKAVGKDLFDTGRAPYQDLADAALKLYGKDSSKSLAGLLTKKVAGAGDGLLTGAAVFEPTVGIPSLVAKKLSESLLKKAATSTNPNFIARFGNKPVSNGTVNHYLAKALGSTASLVGTN